MLIPSGLQVLTSEAGTRITRRAPACLAIFRVLLKMVVPLASGGLVCRSGLIAHGCVACPPVGLLGGFLGLFLVCGCSAMLCHLRSACRWGRRGRILGGL